MSKDNNSPTYYLNSVLLDVYGALIAYKKNNDLYALSEHFNNDMIGSYQYYTAQNESKIEKLLASTSALACQLSMLDCCPAHDECYEHETRQQVEEYMPSLIAYVDSCNIPSLLDQLFSHLVSAFQEDYANTYQRLINNEIDLLEAKKSIAYWQGAISDEALQEAVMLMQYSYFKYLLQAAS